jgi:hypothetical protein
MFTIDLGFSAKSGFPECNTPQDIQAVNSEGVIGRIRAGWFAAGGWGSILWFHLSPAAILSG